MKGYDEWKLDSGYPDGDADPPPVPDCWKEIITHYDPKPIAIRRFDWSAVTDQYDGEIDSPVGYGATEKEAMIDLQDQLSEGCSQPSSRKDNA